MYCCSAPCQERVLTKCSKCNEPQYLCHDCGAYLCYHCYSRRVPDFITPHYHQKLGRWHHIVS